jgi:hypothetical protein
MIADFVSGAAEGYSRGRPSQKARPDRDWSSPASVALDDRRASALAKSSLASARWCSQQVVLTADGERIR